VLHVGRLKKYKATHHLLQAARLLKDRGMKLTTVIVGDGDDKPRLEALAARLGLGAEVRFTGFIPEAEKVNWYRRSAVLVENSVKEGWGLIVMEANACGTPVVAANSPGLRDSSKDGVNGLMYEYGDVPSLAEKLEKLLSDDVLRNRLGHQGIAWAKQWTWDGAAEAMERVVEQTINETR
jgi:glycosyltransferase involved in cell wall biosynthesis